jgi:malonyl-CoA O-methyltransferase
MPGLRAELALPERRASRRAFDRASETFAQASVVHDLARGRLLDRLDFVRIDPTLSIDLGAGTGAGALELAEHFPRSTVLAVDTSGPLLRALARNFERPARVTAVAADAAHLPLVSRSAGLILANMVLPWCLPHELFAEAARVLEPGGLLLFATLGPDSLAEVRRAWAEVDDQIHVHAFFDMHDLGDAAVAGGLAEPVVDVERIALTYTDVASLVGDLRACAAINTAAGRRRSLTGKTRWRQFESSLHARRTGPRFTVTVELILGQAWGRASAPPGESVPGEVAVPIERLGGSRKSVSQN